MAKGFVIFKVVLGSKFVRFRAKVLNKVAKRNIRNVQAVAKHVNTEPVMPFLKRMNNSTHRWMDKPIYG